MNAYDHYQAAERELDRADRIENSDHWPSDSRPVDVANALAAAQVHATLALAGDLEDLSANDERLHSVKL